MADFAEIIKKHAGEDGNIPAAAIQTLITAIRNAVGNAYVEKERYKEKLTEIDELTGKLQTAEDSAATAEKWKGKYDALKGDYEAYQRDQTAKETKAAKAKAVRDWYKGRGITGKALDIAMRGSTAEIEALELDGDGKIKDAAALEALVKGDFSGLVGHTATRGADTATPPVGTGGSALTKADIYKRDEKGRYVMSASKRQKALLENQIM